jgi:hypothetical protein
MLVTEVSLIPPVPPVYKSTKIKEPQCEFCGSLIEPFCKTDCSSVCYKKQCAKTAETVIIKAKNE